MLWYFLNDLYICSIIFRLGIQTTIQLDFLNGGCQSSAIILLVLNVFHDVVVYNLLPKLFLELQVHHD